MFPEKSQLAALDETNRLLATMIRLQLSSQAEAIQELHRAGIQPKRIAELIGTTANTVNVAVQRAKKKPASKGGKS
jgi:DNA-binding NarL/FixJ family response regulator